MVHLTIDNCYVSIVLNLANDPINAAGIIDTDLMQKIRSLCSYTPKSTFYAKTAYGKKPICLMVGNKIPTGFLQDLKALLIREGVSYSVHDNRATPKWYPPDMPLPKKLLVSLRGYQAEGVQFGLANPRAIFKWPPGSGKTELLIALAATIGKPCLWLTSSKNVLRQTQERIAQRLGDDHSIEVFLPEQLTSKLAIPTIIPEGVLNNYKVLIIDECHHTTAKTWYQVAMACNAPYRYAVSATPYDTPDGNMQLKAAVGDNVSVKTYGDMYDGGYLSKPTVRMINYNTAELTSVATRDIQVGAVTKVKATVWDKLYRAGIAECDKRNAAAMTEIAYYLRKGIRPLVICRLIDAHAMPMAQHCLNAGWCTRTITGSSSDQERVDAIGELIAGKIDVLISTCILGEGQDIPDLQAVINLTAGDGVKNTIQIAGRVMRPNSPAFVSDFYDIHHKVLFRHSEARRMHYRSIQANIETVTHP